MKFVFALTITCLLAATPAALAVRDHGSSVRGDYLEVRTCDVYTGPCFANAEMGLTGKEGILVWSVREGQWEGQDVSGLGVMAVVRANDTLGDLQINQREGKALILVDARADSKQRTALVAMAKELSGALSREVADVQSVPMTLSIGACKNSGCATVQAGQIVTVKTRCLGSEDHVCGNEEVYYPPLTQVVGATPAFTEVATFAGRGLDQTWQAAEQRGAFLGTFAR